MPAEAAQFEVHRPALTGHCYRMLGSAFDADDAVQETMIRAWRNREQFDGRASLRTWLYQIATNVCLDELKAKRKRAHPVTDGLPGTPSVEALRQRPGSYWIEPMLDTRVLPAEGEPGERAILRQNIRLAFIAALQKLGPKQRAALLLTEVVGCTAAEAASALNTSVAAVTSATQRARAALAARSIGEPAELTTPQRNLVDQYVAAFEAYDVDQLVTLLRHDATFCMPPFSLWLQGPGQVRTWMSGPGIGCRGSRLIAASANGWPAYAQYRPEDEGGGYRAWALIVLELAGDQISGVTAFLDTERLFPHFGLPLTLPA
jgi:RNA polymerase sigma-70 factor, ECF subfamily